MTEKNEIVERLTAERNTAFAELETITDKIVAEGRDALSDDEKATFEKRKTEVDDLDERIKLATETAERRAKAGAVAVAAGNGGVVVGAEPRTYSLEAERRDRVSFLRDVMRAGQDFGAADRLRRHMTEAREHEAAGLELRDVGTGAFAGLTVPQYLTDLAAPRARAGRPFADLATSHPLPPDGMTVNISRITTGSAAAVQAAENDAVNEQNMDDTLLTVNVRTITAGQDVSRQAIDRGTGIDSIVVTDLMSAYNTELDDGILNDDGTSGTHLGVRSTVGIVAVTYTDASPTAAEAYPKLFDLISQIQSGVFAGADALVMLPRRWWWFASQVGTTMPFIQAFQTATSVGGAVESMTYGNGPAGIIAGLPVFLDGNLPSNLGVGTNEDVILGVTRAELHLWEDASAPLLIRTDEALSGNLTVRFVVYGYSAFTAGRYPGAHGTITGTGFVTPTF